VGGESNVNIGHNLRVFFGETRYSARPHAGFETILNRYRRMELQIARDDEMNRRPSHVRLTSKSWHTRKIMDSVAPDNANITKDLFRPIE
jgi:hypothetical protein